MYGLSPAVHQAADRFRAAGHDVARPDLYDGRVVDTPEEGIAMALSLLGFSNLDGFGQFAVGEGDSRDMSVALGPLAQLVLPGRFWTSVSRQRPCGSGP